MAVPTTIVGGAPEQAIEDVTRDRLRETSRQLSQREEKIDMRLERITLDPDPYEPFRLAQGYRVDDFLFISGQAAIDQGGRIVGVGDFDAQAQQAFENLERVLRAGGSSLENVVKVTIYLTDMSYFEKIVELRGKWFAPPYPADTIVEVGSLYSRDAMIEIEAVAIADAAAERV